MKVKALIKSVTKSKKMKFGNTLNDLGYKIIIDGIFVPYDKAREDKRKIDTFYVNVSDSKRIEFNINTVYVKESTSHYVKESKKKDKKKKKG